MSQESVETGDGKGGLVRLTRMKRGTGPLKEKDTVMNWTKALTGATLAAVFGLGLFAALPAQAQDETGMGMGGQGMMAGGPGAGPMFDFETLDADKDGKVTKAEVAAARTARVAAADANSDGKLSVDEIAALQMARMAERANDRATRMVAELDADGDGMLTVSELNARPVPDRMFDRMDTDGDDAISQAEFAAMQAQMQDRVQGKRGRGHGGDGHGQMGGWFGGGNN
jgi:Ca2+-binding EF-hand superfamily protein